MFLGSCGAATWKSAVIKRGLKKNERLAKANTRSGGEAGELPSAGTTFPCQGKPCTWRQGAKAAMEDSEIHAVGRTCNLAHVKGNWLHLRSVKVCITERWHQRERKEDWWEHWQKNPLHVVVKQYKKGAWSGDRSVIAYIHVVLPPATVLQQSLAAKDSSAQPLQQDCCLPQALLCRVAQPSPEREPEWKKVFRTPGLFPVLDLLL